MSLKVWRSFSSPQGGVEEIDGAISDNAAVESQFGALHLCGLAFWLWWGYVDVPMNSGLSLKFSGKQLKQHERGDLLGDAIDIAGVKSTLGEVGRAN